MARGCYLYAVLSRETLLPKGLTGFGGAGLFTVPCRALAVAASAIDAAEVRPTPEHLLLHQEVVGAIHLGVPILPIRFGTVLSDPAAVARAVEERYAVLLGDLNRLGDKVEVGFAALWTPPVADGALNRSGNGMGGGDSATPMGAGARYLRIRLVEHQREELLRTRATMLARAFDSRLRRHALGSRLSVLPTPRLALKASYLAEPSQLNAFRVAFDELRGAYPDLRFLLSGPWPPYSFVTPPGAPSPVSMEEAGQSQLSAATRQSF